MMNGKQATVLFPYLRRRLYALQRQIYDNETVISYARQNNEANEVDVRWNREISEAHAESSEIQFVLEYFERNKLEWTVRSQAILAFVIVLLVVIAVVAVMRLPWF